MPSPMNSIKMELIPTNPVPEAIVQSSHTGDPRQQMKVPRKQKRSSSPQDPRAQSVGSTVLSSIAPTQPDSSNPMSKWELPPGINVPASIDPNVMLISDHANSLLKQLNPNQIQAALNEFDEAMKVKGDRVRNVQAYFVGVIKRYINVNKKERTFGAAMGDDLTPVVKVTLQKLVDSGFCTQMELDQKVLSKLKMLSEHDALLAIDEIAGVERNTIRNFPSYFMGILNRYMRGADAQKSKTDRKRDRGFKRDDGRDLDRRSRKDDDDRYRRRRGRSPESDYDDRRYRRRGGRRRDRDDYSDDGSSISSDDYRRRRRRDRSLSPSQDRYRDRRRYRSRSRSRSRSPGYRRERRSDRRSNGDRHGNKPVTIPHAGAMQFPPGAPVGMTSIPPPPPPPPPRNAQGVPQFPPLGIQLPPHPQQVPPAGVNPFHAGGVNMIPYPNQQMLNPYGSATPQVIGQIPKIPADILGIAEKAASAVQALNNAQNAPLMSVPQPSRQPPLSLPPGSNAEFSPMIQYSVQNLQVTGHLDASLSDNAHHLLKRLPEAVALQALEKFSSCDKNVMRNKEAYLCGILKKASRGQV